MNEIYIGAWPVNDYRYYLEHSSKGKTWKKHKYIRIENGRYIYPSKSSSLRKKTNPNISEIRNRIMTNPENRAELLSNARNGNHTSIKYRDNGFTVKNDYGVAYYGLKNNNATLLREGQGAGYRLDGRTSARFKVDKDGTMKPEYEGKRDKLKARNTKKRVSKRINKAKSSR